MTDKTITKATPIPGSVQAKMQRGERLRYALGTAESVGSASDTKGVTNARG